MADNGTHAICICCTGQFHSIICGWGKTREMFAASPFPCQEKDFQWGDNKEQNKAAEPSAKEPSGVFDSQGHFHVLHSAKYTHTHTHPETFIWAHPAPLYCSQLQRASHNSISAADEIGNHVSLRSGRDWSSLGWELEYHLVSLLHFFFWVLEDFEVAPWRKLAF